MTIATAYNILEIDSEIRILRIYGDVYKTEIDTLNQRKIEIYEEERRTTNAELS